MAAHIYIIVFCGTFVKRFFEKRFGFRPEKATSLLKKLPVAKRFGPLYRREQQIDIPILGQNK